jgi:alpha-glucosidase (family GH31 glycosyl hydrolase)
LHQALVPFFYSLACEAYADDDVILTPLGAETDWPGDYRFLVGDAFLVAPILDETFTRAVAFPEGRFFSLFDAAAAPIEGPTTIDVSAADPLTLPVFVRDGAIVPLVVENDALPFIPSLPDHTTVLVYPGATTTRFVVHDEDGETTTLSATGGTASATLALTRVVADTLFAIRAPGAATVTLDDEALAAAADLASLADTDGFFVDGDRVLVRVAARSDAASIAITDE